MILNQAENTKRLFVAKIYRSERTEIFDDDDDREVKWFLEPTQIIFGGKYIYACNTLKDSTITDFTRSGHQKETVYAQMPRHYITNETANTQTLDPLLLSCNEIRQKYLKAFISTGNA